MKLRAALISLLLLAAPAASPNPAAASDVFCPMGMRCLTVSVPLDRGGGLPGTLELPVVVDRGRGPVLLFLGGGPGQSMVESAEGISGLADYLAPGHRVAVLDQRGTGATALRCPALQRLPLTDLTVPPKGAVRECGQRLLRVRRLFTTTETVHDLEAVRQALGAGRMAILGVSYGSYVAQRYARAHPERVRSLVLDSVVPQQNVDPFQRANMRAARRVLRSTCPPGSCPHTANPVADLHRLVRAAPFSRRVGRRRVPVKVDGPALLDWLATAASFQQELLPPFTRAVSAALDGNRMPIARFGALTRRAAPATPAGLNSWGLHSATLCTDLALPFSPAAPRARRQEQLARATGRIGNGEVRPFSSATARGNGLIQTCLQWPATRVDPPPEPGLLPRVPTLLLAGGHDMSTPLEDAREALRLAPRGRLIVVPRGGHGAIFTAECAGRAVREFFSGRLRRDPCRRRRPV